MIPRVFYRGDIMRLASCIAIVMWVSRGGAQAAAATSPMPLRPLGRTLVTSSVPLSGRVDVRGLSDGRVLVHDHLLRVVFMLDSMLGNARMVIDSAAGKNNSYGSLPCGIVPYRADSTLFIDPSSSSLLVISPAGLIARQMATPSITGYMVSALTGGSGTPPGVDARGRLVYRALVAGPPAVRPAPGPVPRPPTPIDSALIVATDLQMRTLDTVARFRITPLIRPSASGPPPGTILPPIDDWVVTPDGTIAIVRGQDYHIDWIHADGTQSSSPKVPFAWQRLSDADKQRIADSVTAVRDSAVAHTPPGRRLEFDAFGQLVAGPAPVGGRAPGGPPTATPAPPLAVPPPISPAAIPDYLPAITKTGLHADYQGRIWVETRPTTPRAGGPIFDVVSPAGLLVDRIQIPEGRTLPWIWSWRCCLSPVVRCRCRTLGTSTYEITRMPVTRCGMAFRTEGTPPG